MRGLSNDLGPDCAARQGATRAPRALLDDLKGDWPDTFDDLAGRGGDPQQRRVRAVGRKESSSQLALVNADGNKLGSFFEALNTFDLDVPNLRNRAPGDVDFATRTAVEIAASSIHEPTDRHKSAIPHYVGGDDVLVSVPAARAWTFVTELIRGFSTLQDTLRACLACDIPEEGAARELLDRIAELSLGVGVAFTHATHPVSDATVHAELALKAAKREFRGQAAGIAWVDLTADGLTGARAGRRWIQVVSADEAFRQLLPTPVGASIAEQAALEVFALPPAARHRLGQILRDSSLGAAAGRVSTWAGRRAHDGAAVPKAISQLAQDDTDRLRALLSRARWWPRANREDQP
ncbi:Cas10/Cmr2 second palm domain-containing protein [Propionicicella superfundia]|uniref:Cas10/Cmr2 second palm domain-containing protein n=1 Tax=Propionicicella superfundia TaxID=348582 RepID=UPI00048C0019|nr:hypothetical protein [Propionicicella superfundia]